MYIDTLNNIVDKYNDAYHKTIKTKPLDMKSSTYTVGKNDKDPKFKVPHERIRKYQNIFPDGCKQIGGEKFLLLKKYHGHMLLMILMVKNSWNFL